MLALKKMRIAYLVNQYPMASLTFVRREIAELERLGHVVERFSIQPWSERVVDELDLREKERTRYLKVGLAFVLAPFRIMSLSPLRLCRTIALLAKLAKTSDRSLFHHLAYLAEASRLRIWLAETDIQHLHIHFATNSTEVGLLCHALGGPPFSFTVHGPEEFDRAAYQSLSVKASHASFVAAISSFGRSQLMRWVEPSEWRKLKVVHCGLDNLFIDREPSLLMNSLRFVCVGRLCEQKGQLLLVEAVERLIADGQSMELILVGDGPMRSEIESRIRDSQLESHIRITGWASGETVRREIEQARVFVLPSFAEGLPVVIMEAMAMGRPVISTYVAGIPELVIPGENGWLVPAGDVQALVDAMREAINSPVERLREMGVAGRRRVLERHDIRKEVAKLARLIQAGDEQLE